MNRLSFAASIALSWFALLAASPALAQGAAADSAAAARRPMARASWLSDRTPLRAGDILTVVIDEQTSARERVSNEATGRRGQTARFKAVADGEDAVGTTEIGTGMQADSRDIGEAARQGDLVGVISVQVVSVEANGVARIEGAKTVTVDGRAQEISVKGSVRPEDVSSDNVIYSSRIAGGEISYKGKKIGPRMGIIGKILSIIWP